MNFDTDWKTKTLKLWPPESGRDSKKRYLLILKLVKISYV